MTVSPTPMAMSPAAVGAAVMQSVPLSTVSVAGNSATSLCFSVPSEARQDSTSAYRSLRSIGGTASPLQAHSRGWTEARSKLQRARSRAPGRTLMIFERLVPFLPPVAPDCVTAEPDEVTLEWLGEQRRMVIYVDAEGAIEGAKLFPEPRGGGEIGWTMECFPIEDAHDLVKLRDWYLG